MKFDFNTLSGFLSNFANRAEYNLLGVELAMTGRSKEDRAPLYGEWCKEIEDSLAGSALDFDWFYYGAMAPDANFSTGAIEGLDSNGAKEAVKRVNEIIGKDLFKLAPSEPEGNIIVCCINVYKKNFLAKALEKNRDALESVYKFISESRHVQPKVRLEILS